MGTFFDVCSAHSRSTAVTGGFCCCCGAVVRSCNVVLCEWCISFLLCDFRVICDLWLQNSIAQSPGTMTPQYILHVFFSRPSFSRERSSDSQVAVAGQEHKESLACGFYREETGEKDALKTPLIKHSCGTNVTTPTRRPGTHCWRAVLFEFFFSPF